MEATRILNKVLNQIHDCLANCSGYSFLEPLHGRRDKKIARCILLVFRCSPLDPNLENHRYLALFVQKRCAWIHISEWGILYLITKIGFLLVKTQNQANFLVFEGFLGEKILHQYYALT